MKRSGIVIALLLLAAAALVQISAGPLVADTTGVVTSMADPPNSSSAPMQSVNVTLADGSKVRANVIPGCIVSAGDPVRLKSFRGEFLDRTYLVLGPA